MEQVGVLSKRLWGYSYAISYFQSGEPDEHQSGDEEVAKLVKAWESVMYSMARIAVTGRNIDAQTMEQKFEGIKVLEHAVKDQLWQSYQRWGERNGVTI
ncbi:hypothetical protein D3C76_1039880 [compost metagenome]